MSRKEEYEWLKAHNICVSCRSAEATRGVKCDECADKDLDRRHKRLDSMSDAEKMALKEKNKAYLQKRYAERREKGLCAECGKPIYKNHSRCYECYLREKRINREIQSNKTKGYAEIGLCRICGEKPVKGYHYCEKHLQEQRQRMAYASQFRKRGGNNERGIYGIACVDSEECANRKSIQDAERRHQKKQEMDS